MSDDVRARLSRYLTEAEMDDLDADPSLLVVAKPKCERCDGSGVEVARLAASVTCPDCSGTGYDPMVAIPAKAAAEWAAVVRGAKAAFEPDWDQSAVWNALARCSPEAVRLAQEVRP